MDDGETPARFPRRRWPLAWTLRLGLGAALLLSSGALLYGVSFTVARSKALAERSLESTAVSLASSVEAALRAGAGAEARAILSDRVVAYATIVSPGGEVLFHTNPELEGTRQPSGEVAAWLSSGRPWSRRTHLGTGTPVFEFYYPLHRPDGGTEALRLVLHAAPAERLVAEARRLWWAAGALLAVLWVGGLSLDRVAGRQVRLHEELERRERLSLVGQMTATLAHEIRNALGSIKGFAQWVDERTPATDGRKPGLAALLQGVARVEALVRGLLAYAREESYRLEAVDAGEAMREALAELSWGGDVTLTAERLAVRADREKLHRTLMNGIQNARDAMGGEGRLTLGAAAEGRWVVLRIEDEGPGVRPEDAPRLFTPFFTTRAAGTGLGLAYSKKVVEGMGGEIDLANRPRGGAVLTLRLPRA
ncbi:MAG: hypothetical protein HZB55_11130 [Deltaproteobacteria bacterium]|nr:hypothetical protein [Deltaproteobacteria bacterium]